MNIPDYVLSTTDMIHTGHIGWLELQELAY